MRFFGDIIPKFPPKVTPTERAKSVRVTKGRDLNQFCASVNGELILIDLGDELLPPLLKCSRTAGEGNTMESEGTRGTFCIGMKHKAYP
jgi:hypothetical protein